MPVEEYKRQTRVPEEVKYLKPRERLLEILFVPCDDRHVSTSLREKNSQCEAKAT
jgi:hypothetical protein